MRQRLINRWTLAALALVVVIVAGAAVIAARYEPAQPLAIAFDPPPEVSGKICINGQAAAPGWYDLRPGDTIEDILAASGAARGTSANISLYIGAVTGEQRININTAGAWLLQALPGVGETRAEAIIAYRVTHGLFRDVDELTAVEGIGPGLLEDIRDLIMVGE